MEALNSPEHIRLEIFKEANTASFPVKTFLLYFGENITTLQNVLVTAMDKETFSNTSKLILDDFIVKVARIFKP